ncbi:hypothetical protein I6E38_08505 [Prevotella stercorea]|uniref:hypothetical protein n=1 Tax=Leyella stercorea TaxID=363265 RepID=UPI001F2D1AA1|nr:hypothetical protein [Leyella stercorea]MCF2579149.1 hypothetical protein [Leyella stercorea]
MSNIDLKAQLAKQMLGYLHNELIKDANEPTLYRLSYGQYEVSSYKGELLIEFDTQKPGYSIYYGFMITKNGIDRNEATKINNIFVPIRQHLEFVLKKVVYLTDGIYNSRVYWAFWLRCNDFDIDSAKKHMEIIQDYFNQLTISKYNVVKL